MSTDKFNRAIETATAEAVNDLPKVLAQWQQGQNPGHAKAIQAIETLLAVDTDLDEESKKALEARAESMRPKLNWDKKTVGLMVTLVLASDIHDHEIAKQVKDEVLKSKGTSAVGSGRGRPAGSTVERVSGVAEKMAITCHLCQPAVAIGTKRCDAVSSPNNLANFTRTHIAEAHKVATSTKVFSEAITAARANTGTVEITDANGAVMASFTPVWDTK
jgi:hypothetical protein